MIIPQTAVPAKYSVLLCEIVVYAKADLLIVVKGTGDGIEVVHDTRTLRQGIQLENIQRYRCDTARGDRSICERSSRVPASHVRVRSRGRGVENIRACFRQVSRPHRR